jgi:tetratricopeptide repeat protein 21B
MALSADDMMVTWQLLLARARFLSLDLEGALRGAGHVLRMEPSFAEAHMLAAQVYLYDGKHRMAGQSIEQAVSHSFHVRDTLLYHIIQAKARIKLQNRRIVKIR